MMRIRMMKMMSLAPKTMTKTRMTRKKMTIECLNGISADSQVDHIDGWCQDLHSLNRDDLGNLLGDL